MTNSRLAIMLLLSSTLVLTGCWGDDKDKKTTEALSKSPKQDKQENKEDSIAEGEKDAKADTAENTLKNQLEGFDSSEVDIKTIKQNTVVGRVGDEDITAKDVINMMQHIPNEMRKMPMDVLFLAFRDQLINLKVLNQEAQRHAAALLDSDAGQKALEKAKTQIVMDLYIKKITTVNDAQKAVRSEYQKFLDKFPTESDEVKVYQIVVKTEDEAKAVLDDLNDGVDFLKIARDRSIDKSTAEKDGEVPGYLNKLQANSLLPGYDIIFKQDNGKDVIPTGSYTKTPIATPMGYFVLKVMERRPLKAPSFESLKPMLEMQMKQKLLDEQVKKLMNNVSVERYHPNSGKPMESLELQVERLKAILQEQANKTKTGSDKS